MSGKEEWGWRVEECVKGKFRSVCLDVGVRKGWSLDVFRIFSLSVL